MSLCCMKSAIHDLPQYWFYILWLCFLVYSHRRAVEGSLAIRGVFGKVNVVYCKEDTSSFYDIGRQVYVAIILHPFNDGFLDFRFYSQQTIVLNSHAEAVKKIYDLFASDRLMNRDAHCKLLGHFPGRVNGLGLLVLHLPIGQTHSYRTLHQMHGPFLYLRAFVFMR